MWKFKSPLMGEEEEEEDNFLGEGSDGLCSLSPMQRMYGFGGSLDVGLLLILLSLITFAKPIKFAVVFTLGNILAVGSTAFLIVPAQQARLVFDPVRVYASAIYIGSVIPALIFALLGIYLGAFLVLVQEIMHGFLFPYFLFLRSTRLTTIHASSSK